MGAWDTIYQHDTRAELPAPEAYGILAIKAELVYNGATNVNLQTPVIGDNATRAIRAFQRSHGLTVDGQVGPQTARALYRSRVASLDSAYHLEAGVLCGIASLESEWDPAAVGVVDPGDLGIVQIHMAAHPGITVVQAFTPAWALGWAASVLQSAHRALLDWDATIASWNVGGGGADAWLAAGKPASLFVPWFTGPDGKPLDLGARATRYVELVRGQRC